MDSNKTFITLQELLYDISGVFTDLHFGVDEIQQAIKRTDLDDGYISVLKLKEKSIEVVRPLMADFKSVVAQYEENESEIVRFLGSEYNGMLEDAISFFLNTATRFNDLHDTLDEDTTQDDLSGFSKALDVIMSVASDVYRNLRPTFDLVRP